MKTLDGKSYPKMKFRHTHPSPSSSLKHFFSSTIKHLEKIRLNMVFAFFINIRKSFLEQTKI